MSDIQLYLFEVDSNKPEAHRVAKQSAEKLEKKQLKLIDLITSLEEYINNKDDATLRSKSIGYLADVLENMPSKVLSLQERRLLTDFILGRLEGDVEGVGASARALIALEQRGKWDIETAQRVMSTFMNHAHPIRQFKLQTERFPIIQLIDLLLAKYRTAIKELHDSDSQFMEGFIAYFEGEKDPRNLMIIFSLLLVPMAEWEIHAFARDMFEAVFNYFPITFKPPPDDPYGITAQDLKDRLRDCIAANSEFAPYAFPALLDKLDSTSMNTKRDVLTTIQACIEGYSANTINLYSVTLWDALKFEILSVQEENLAQEALKALALMGIKFSNTEGPLNAYLRPIIKECNEHLEDAPTKQSQAAGRILSAIAKGHPAVASQISKGILPVLFSLYQSTNSVAKRRGLLEVYNDLVKAYLESQSMGVAVDPEALQNCANEALQAMLSALANAPKAEVSFRLTAMKGLTQLVSVRKVLSDEQISLAVDAIDQLILHERVEGHGNIRAESIDALVEMAGSVPESVRSQSVPAFMVDLPDASEDRTQYGPVLEAFVQLSQEQQIFDTVVLRLKNKLKSSKTNTTARSYHRDLLLGILYCFVYGSPLRDEGGSMRSSYFTEYAEPLIWGIRDTLPSARDDALAEIIGRLSNTILRQQTPHFQSTIYNKNLEWVSTSTTQDLSEVQHRVKTLAPFSLYYYAALRPQILDPEDIVSSLRAEASHLLDQQDDQYRDALVTRQLSLLINKFPEPKTTETLLKNAGIEVEDLLTGEHTTNRVAIAFAVVKALMVQGKCSGLTSKYISILLQVLPSADVSFARRFAGLLAPDDILTKDNHCVVSSLYKQRSFTQIVQPMIDMVRSAEPANKPKFLIAMSGVLRWLPYAVIESSLSSLVAPLLQSLDVKDLADHEVKYSTLTIFESLLMHDPTIAAEHSASLITRLLNCTQAPDNQAKVRETALRCLSLVPKQLKREAVMPYRRPVVKKLLECLDDGKRNVRSQAVKCRTNWLGLEESTEEEEE